MMSVLSTKLECFSSTMSESHINLEYRV